MLSSIKAIAKNPLSLSKPAQPQRAISELDREKVGRSDVELPSPLDQDVALVLAIAASVATSQNKKDVAGSKVDEEETETWLRAVCENVSGEGEGRKEDSSASSCSRAHLPFLLLYLSSLSASTRPRCSPTIPNRRRPHPYASYASSISIPSHRPHPSPLLHLPAQTRRFLPNSSSIGFLAKLHRLHLDLSSQRLPNPQSPRDRPCRDRRSTRRKSRCRAVRPAQEVS